MTEGVDLLPEGFEIQTGGAETLPEGYEVDPLDHGPGAPANVRAYVGSIASPADRLTALRQYYPDAQPMPGDPENFYYTDPQTKKVTVYNPAGLDIRDLASIPREIAQMVGGAAGAALGVPAIPVAGPAAPFVGAGLGTAAGEEVTDLVMGALGAPETRSVPEQLRQTALTGGAGSVGQLGGAVVGQAGREFGKRIGRMGEAPEVVGEAISDLERFGATPSLAQATREPLYDSLETFISRTPGGHGRIRKAATQTMDSVAQSIDRRAENLAGTGALEPELAGRAATRGIQEFADSFRIRGGRLFDRLDKYIPAEQPVTIDNTIAAAKDLTDFIPELPELNKILVTPGVERIAAALPEGQIPYSVLKRLRTAIGKKISRPSLTDDIPTGDLKALYGAITEDMRAAAAGAGPAGTKAFNTANNYWRAGMGRIEDTLQPMIKNKAPEKVFTALESGARQGPTNIRTLRRSLKPDQWRQVAATVIQRMGRAVPGQQGAEGGEFSFETFLTNWNKYSPQAKAALFEGPGMRGMRADLDALARASERIRESSRAFANPSGTSQGLIGQAMFLGGAGAAGLGAVTGNVGLLTFPATLALAALGANQAARLMTNRNFIRWLASGTKVKPEGMAAHLGRLSGVAAMSDLDTREDIMDFLNVFNQASARGQQRTQQQAPTQ